MATQLSEKTAETTPAVEPTREAPVFAPTFDIVENENEIVLFGDLPGVSESGLDVRYEDEQLIIHGKVERRDEGVRFAHREYGIGDFHRTFAIDESVDAEKISAELGNGVLTIHLPKSEQAKPRRIPVRSV